MLLLGVPVKIRGKYVMNRDGEVGGAHPVGLGYQAGQASR